MQQIAKRMYPGLGFNTRQLIICVGLLCGLFAPSLPAADSKTAGFNHLSTGFPLTGAHAQADCQTCHARGMFKGTPRDCVLCHTQGSRLASSFKPTNHVPTTQSCDQCHTSSVTWTGARFSHMGVVAGNCASCHNGSTAQGKPANHIQTNASCDSCHRTTAWIPAKSNHAGVMPGTCSICHNGSSATGKPARHIQTTAACDVCHRMTAWIPTLGTAGIHTGVIPGTCATCHGVTASGKPATHVATIASCDVCHRTIAWLPATFSHASVTTGTCLTCHGVSAKGKPAGHIPASMSCDACHGTSVFTSSTMKNHTVSQGVVPGGCLTCHSGAYSSQGARGKPNGHPNTGTNTSCDGSGCHTTRTFSK